MSYLSMLEDAQVVSFSLNTDRTKVSISEECDNYFARELSKHELGGLIDELEELRKSMVHEMGEL